jgi:1-phosphofructokinase family hexose kinase
MVLTVTLNPSIDRTLFVDRIKTCDTNRVKLSQTDAGGKGINVARVLAALGTKVTATGFLGGRNGHLVRGVLTEEGVDCDFVRVDEETRVNISIEEDAQHCPPTTFNEPGPNINDEEWERLVHRVKSAAGHFQWITFGGSLPPGVPKDAYSQLVDIAQKEGAKAVLDADAEVLSLALNQHPYMIKPNVKEAERLLQKELPDEAACMSAAKELNNKGIPLVVLSRGAEGAIIVSGGVAYRAIPPKIEAKSTIGSGDSMIAGILYSLIQNCSIDEALRWGTASGAATALTSGADICTRQQVEDLLSFVKVERL